MSSKSLRTSHYACLDDEQPVVAFVPIKLEDDEMVAVSGLEPPTYGL
jgi:hypothetical protein